MRENITNCCNCGAVMEYSKQYYGSMHKCPYCGTEHHIDKLGRIEEYKVKFMFCGHLFECYLSAIKREPSYIETTRLYDSTMKTYINHEEYEFTFIGNMCNENIEK